MERLTVDLSMNGMMFLLKFLFCSVHQSSQHKAHSRLILPQHATRATPWFVPSAPLCIHAHMPADMPYAILPSSSAFFASFLDESCEQCKVQEKKNCTRNQDTQFLSSAGGGTTAYVLVAHVAVVLPHHDPTHARTCVHVA